MSHRMARERYSQPSSEGTASASTDDQSSLSQHLTRDPDVHAESEGEAPLRHDDLAGDTGTVTP